MSIETALAKHCRYEMSLTPSQQEKMAAYGVWTTQVISEFVKQDGFSEEKALAWIQGNLKSMANFKLNYSKKHRDEFGELEKSILAGETYETKGWLFITIGFDDKVAKPLDMKRIIKKIKLMRGMKWEHFRYVHEKHRKNTSGGIYHHLHTHILARTDVSKSKFLQYIYPRNAKSFLEPVVAGKNFIDVKTPKDGDTFSGKLRYIEGDKAEAKLECVQLDQVWRKENSLDEEK